MAKKKGKKVVKAKVKEIKGQLGKKAETAREKMMKSNFYIIQKLNH